MRRGALWRRGRAIRVAGTPEHGAVTTKARELVALARRSGYAPDELVRIIRQLS